MVKDVISETAVGLKDAAPKLMIVVGVAGLVVSGVWACINTRKKLDDAVNDSKEELDQVHADKETLPAKDYRKKLTIAHTRRIGRFARVYGAPAGLAILSILSICGGTIIILRTLSGWIVMYSTLEKQHKDFKQSVDDNFGPGTSEKLELGGKLEKPIKTENAKWEYSNDPNNIYTFIFGKLDRDGRRINKEWCNDRALLYRKLEGFQQGAQDLLVLRMRTGEFGKVIRPGYLYLHEVLNDLFIEPDEDGKIEIAQNCGWIYDPDNPVGDNFVDFGLNSPLNINTFFEPGTDPKDRIFRKDPFTKDDIIFLTFNCDGVIGPKLNPNSRFSTGVNFNF